MTFLDRIRAVDPRRTALISGDLRLTYGDLGGLAEGLPGQIGGLRLFLNTSDLAQAVVTLAALDGRAAAVILSSPALDGPTLNELIALAGADAVLTPRDDVTAAPVIRSAGDLPGHHPPHPVGTQTDWVMTTSGTTGRPKLVRHSFASLTRSARTDQARGADQVWGLLYDYTRFAGLQVVLQSLLSGATLVAPSTDASLEERLRDLAAAGVTHLSATPTLWRKILMTRGCEALALRQVTLGGEIADDAVLDGLGRAWPAARVTHIFASTEAGVGFSVNDRRAGFPVGYLTDPPSGIGLRIVDGHLHVRNEQVGPAYLGGQGMLAEDGWVNTGDMVEIRGDRVLFKGRGSGVINVGGDKVHPEEVERAVLAHPKVRLVRVYAKANPIVGALVAADIVAEADAGDVAALRDELKAFLADRLERHQVPAFIRFVADFDMNAAGKLKRT